MPSPKNVELESVLVTEVDADLELGEILIKVEGEDAKATLDRLVDLVESGLGE